MGLPIRMKRMAQKVPVRDYMICFQDAVVSCVIIITARNQGMNDWKNVIIPKMIF